MYPRGRAVAGRLVPRSPWRWKGSGSTGSGLLRLPQGAASRCCYRARPRDLDASWNKLPPELVPSGSMGPAVQVLFTRKPPEAPTILPALSISPRDNLGIVNLTRLKTSLHPLRHRVETRPTVLSPPGGLEDALTMVDGGQEDDIMVRDNEGLDCASLDSLHSLFHGWQFRSPYQAPEVVLGTLAPFRATDGTLSPERSPQSNDPSMEEHLAVMHQKLQDELPGFFLKTHDYRIYSQDVEFINEILHLRTRGQIMYRLVLTLCRFVAWNYFADLHMEVLKVTRHPENWSIQARWRIKGLPFHVLLFRFYKADKNELYRTYDAYSTFYLDSQGLIRCHRVSKLMPSQPPLSNLKKLVVASWLGLGLSDQRPSLLLSLSALAEKQEGSAVGCRES